MIRRARREDIPLLMELWQASFWRLHGVYLLFL